MWIIINNFERFSSMQTTCNTFSSLLIVEKWCDPQAISVGSPFVGAALKERHFSSNIFLFSY